jgi:hypothetical protein
MREDKTKTLVVNIATVVVVLGVIVSGYLVFSKKDTSTPAGTVLSVETAADTVATGSDISQTVNDLTSLKKAVADSVAIFNMPEFVRLKNFSVAVPSENIGRPNPFVAPAWKVKLQVLQDAVAKKSGGGDLPQVTAPAPVQATALPDTTTSVGI